MSYDARYRIMDDNSGEGTAHTISYGCDAHGVRVTRSESPTASGTANRYYTYSPELQLLNVTDDDSSNVWASGRASLQSAPVPVSHEYAYVNGIPVGEFGPPRTPDSTVALAQPRHRTFVAATTQYYTFADQLGTPILQTDGTGTVVWRAEHEPYGNVWKMRTGSRTDQPLRLPGQDLAMTWEGAEENYNVFRWYRAGWGRYTQVDPIRTGAAIDAYGYVRGRPDVLIDLLGLQDSAITNDHAFQSCCDKALAQGVFDQVGSGGLVMCCNGHKVACAKQHEASNLNGSVRTAYSLALQCTLAHEERHVIDLPLCKCGSDYPAQFASKFARATSECAAAHVELECLEKSKQACNGDPVCINWLEKFKANPQQLAQQFGCK